MRKAELDAAARELLSMLEAVPGFAGNAREDAAETTAEERLIGASLRAKKTAWTTAKPLPEIVPEAQKRTETLTYSAGETGRSVESVYLQEPAENDSETILRFIGPDGTEDAAEALDRRFRRDSRRYDGFFSENEQ